MVTCHGASKSHSAVRAATQRLLLLVIAKQAAMCIQERIPGTANYWRAQQVMGPRIADSESDLSYNGKPASILYGDSGQVSIKVHGTGDVLYAAPSNLDIRNDELAPGDKVKRVMFSGVEEDAIVIRIDSPTHATIRLSSGTQATYSSDIFRLRRVSPAPAKNAYAQAPAESVDAKSAMKRLTSDAPDDVMPGTPTKSDDGCCSCLKSPSRA